MEFIFFDDAGSGLFTRSDMEQGHWVQEEMSVTATFPYLADKVIERGQRIAFRDPATDNLEAFEIRNVTTIEPEQYQQLTAEHIVISELSDEHINQAEIDNKTPAQALGTVLTGTLWSVGNATATNTSSCDISRGSVWQAVNTIQQNWNVYIVPRVTLSGAGTVSGRYLDIIPAGGTFRGVRLSIDKNMSDSTVTYDDTDVLTALYGYGGNVDKPVSGQDDQREELTFADEVWTATSSHPAKPAGQTYLEWPEKTALYGRNGRPRYGYYQNGDIKDAAILLQKTWEALQRTASPKICIGGTTTDLKRLGYADQPLRLHDTAIVEIRQTQETYVKEIIKLDVDLVDPSANRPEIGDYLPNIIYINRDTETKASGGGGGGGRGQTNEEKDESETYSDFLKTNEMIGMVVGTRNGGYYVRAGEISLAINQSGESGSYETSAYINANHVNISATNDVYTLAGDLFHDANGRLVIKSAGGMYVQRTESGTTSMFGVWDSGNLTGGIMVQQINGQSSVLLTGSVIDINSLVTAINSSEVQINAENTTIAGFLQSNYVEIYNLEVTGALTVLGATELGTTNVGSLTADGKVDCGSLYVNDTQATWQTETVVGSISTTSSGVRQWAYWDGSDYSYDSTSRSFVTGVTVNNKTLHFLGY